MAEATLRIERRVKVLMGPGSLERLSGIVEEMQPPKVLVVADRVLRETWLPKVEGLIEDAGLKPRVVEVPGGEGAKSLDTLVMLWRRMAAERLTRDSLVIGLGGGSVLDVAGFAASTYMRGCRLINIPTTLLAQADAAIGGKTGVNLDGKNLVGTFYHPDAVIVDPSLLLTLPDHAYRQGFSEIVKHAVIRGEDALDLVESSTDALKARDPDALGAVIAMSVTTKLEIVEADPQEQGIRVLLNYGHTVAHALERVLGYSISHGEAVAIGINVENQLATRLLGFPPSDAERVRSLLEELGLPTRPPLPPAKLLPHMGLDKKFLGGKPRLPLPARLGVFKVVSMEWGELREWLENLKT